MESWRSNEWAINHLVNHGHGPIAARAKDQPGARVKRKGVHPLANCLGCADLAACGAVLPRQGYAAHAVAAGLLWRLCDGPVLAVSISSPSGRKGEGQRQPPRWAYRGRVTP
jgi:hypothetical protein